MNVLQKMEWLHRGGFEPTLWCVQAGWTLRIRTDYNTLEDIVANTIPAAVDRAVARAEVVDAPRITVVEGGEI